MRQVINQTAARLWWPRTLRVRLILLVLVAVLSAQAFTLYVLAMYRHHQVQATAVNLLVTSISTLQASMALVPALERAAFVNTTSNGQWQLVSELPPKGVRHQSMKGLDPAPPGAQPLRQSLRGLTREVNRALGRGNRIAISTGAQPYLYVSVADSRNMPQWLQIPLDRIDPPLTNWVVFSWFVGLGALLLLALGFSWHITRPVTSLVQATDGLAQGRHELVRPSGPLEIRRLGERFNAMVQSVSQSQSAQKAMLAGLPHDLKGPMARMSLRIEMTDDLAIKSGLKRDLADMQRMVDQLLDFVRGQDPSRLALDRVSFDEWLKACISDYQHLDPTIRLSSDMPKVSVMADRGALSRVLSNLLDNARQYGKPPIHVSLDKRGNWAVLSVVDHGPGIAPHDVQRALQPFERLDESRTTTGRVGLGLSLVQGIALAHGGYIDLGQDHRGGFRVSVYLPCQ
jgi:two-component system, OmpR family, osmolarity sensor histidine kinase EnvZ